MQIATCTADEINVTIALNELRGAEVETFDHDPVVAELAKREPGIDDPASLVDSTFDLIGEDHDAILLWDRSLDGIESDEVVVSLLGYGNLHPRDWFERFESVDP